MTDRIHIVCAGPPVAWARARINRAGKHFTKTSVRRFKKTVGDEAALAMDGRNPLDAPLSMNIMAYMPIPQSWSKRKQEAALHVTTKPDWDNLAKSVTDALNGIVYTDDKLIVEAYVRKLYDKRPRVEITVQPMP